MKCFPSSDVSVSCVHRRPVDGQGGFAAELLLEPKDFQVAARCIAQYTLTRSWECEFEIPCQLMAVCTVVHADATSWSICSVLAIVSEKVRLLVFGCHKDDATLERFQPKQTFDGILIGDDAAIYRHFSKSQECWAHLLRKAIRLTLLAAESAKYRRFLDGLLEVDRTACQSANDQRLLAGGGAERSTH